MNIALELKGVVKNYGKRRALAGLDLKVPQGSIFGLIGSNGAGKTTSMAVSVGLLKTTAGTVNLLGDGPFDPYVHGGRVTLLPQDSRLPLHSKVYDLLLYYGRLQRVPHETLRKSIDEVLEWVHLADRRDSIVRSLSHGMMRRLTIAQAFLGHPELVLLDEPMSGLDPREAVRIRGILGARRGRQTVVISSHNLYELEMLCDTAAFVEGGRLLRQDAMDDLTKRSHRVTYDIRPSAEFKLSELEKILGGSAIELKDNTQMTVRFKEGTGTVEDINRKVIKYLLDTGSGIVEVRRGTDLETEYLASTEPPPLK